MLSGEGWLRWGIDKAWDINEGMRNLWEKEVVVKNGHNDSCSVPLVPLTTNPLRQHILFIRVLVYLVIILQKICVLG